MDVAMLESRVSAAFGDRTLLQDGGTRSAVSDRLIFRANPNGTRKNTSRYNSGGRMINHLPYRLSHALI